MNRHIVRVSLDLNDVIIVSNQYLAKLVDQRIRLISEFCACRIKQQRAVHVKRYILCIKINLDVVLYPILRKCIFKLLRHILRLFQFLLFICFGNVFFFLRLSVRLAAQLLVVIRIKILKLTDSGRNQFTLADRCSASREYAECTLERGNDLLKLFLIHTGHREKHYEETEQEIHKVREGIHPCR